MKKPSPAGAPEAARKLSRRALLRYARANLAAGQAYRAGPALADAPEPAAVSDEVAARDRSLPAREEAPRQLG